MHNEVVYINGYTSGNEYKTLTGEVYVGTYHILTDGTIKSGAGANSPNGKILLPINFVPVTAAGDLVSEYKDESDEFVGTYSVLAIKNYKNDIDLVLESPQVGPPVITAQPQSFFKKNVTPYYIPGVDALIDENNTMRVYRGRTVVLDFDFKTDDAPERVKFQWFDSFDRIVSTEKRLELNTNNIEGADDSFYCIVTDTYGTDTTDNITISIVDADNPFIMRNILKNGSGNEGTAEWESIGEMPEDTGKFLTAWAPTKDPFTAIDHGDGTYYYHKFTTATNDSIQNKNQWYPRPELFDLDNGFNGSVITDITDNYLRAGVFVPLNNLKENDYGGLTKSSTQTIDLSEISNEIDGRVYGLKGFKAVLFGWLGTRADQGDYSKCTYEFLDSNGSVISSTGNNFIASCTKQDRIVNLYPKTPLAPAIDVKLLGGYLDTKNNFDYSGIIYDGNAGAVYDRYATDYLDTDGNIVNGGPEDKTCILGRMSDFIQIPAGTTQIRVTRTYTHDGGLYDLYWEGSKFSELGFDYVSDCMMVGLNLRLYPILIDDSGTEIDSSVDSNNEPAIKGMDFLESKPKSGEESILAQHALGGQSFTSYVEGYEIQFAGMEDIDIPSVLSGETLFNMDVGAYAGYGNTYSFEDPRSTPSLHAKLGNEWTAQCSDSMKAFIRTVAPYPMQRRLYAILTDAQHPYNGAFPAPDETISTGGIIGAVASAAGIQLTGEWNTVYRGLANVSIDNKWGSLNASAILEGPYAGSVSLGSVYQLFRVPDNLNAPNQSYDIYTYKP